ncbi:MAG: DUF1957 domain-containing protein [Treponema sp.]|nr:DUF1957 domain-containing protein [Treponema sp.]
MSNKNLVLHINSHQDYLANSENHDSEKFNILFSSITQTFLPLLNMFANLEADGIFFKVSMVFTPSLCAMLADPVIQQAYIEWLDKLISFGETQISKNPNAEKYLKQLRYAKRDFTETLNQDILSKIDYYARRGNIELLATAATNCFLPHYIDLPEAINAQIETGLLSHRNFFSTSPEGFYLPFMGYTQGIERFIKSYGLRYTVLDSHGLLFADPVPQAGIFSPARCYNSLMIFPKDNETDELLFGENGYINNEIYLDTNRDVGFEEKLSKISKFLNSDKMRISTGFKYWTKNNEIYDEQKANAQAIIDATNFLNNKSEKLQNAQDLLKGSDVCDVCVFDSELFGQKWAEGLIWLEQIFRQANKRDDINLVLYEDLTSDPFSYEKIQPFLSSNEGGGYGENLLDSSTGWMLRYVRKACERMIDLSSRFIDDTGLKARSLNLGAKEVLLAQSSDWAKMISSRSFPEYAKKEFTNCIINFTTLFDSLGSNSISTEWLTNTEKAHTIFPWINYHIFSPKK